MKANHKSVMQELKLKTYTLQERIKEQNCLLNISRCFTLKDTSLKKILKKIIDYIIPACQFPEKTYARIIYKKIDIKSETYTDTPYKFLQNLIINDSYVGLLEIGYTEIDVKKNENVFFEEEIRLFKAIKELVENIIEKKNIEIAIQQTSYKLEENTKELEKKNYALKEILSQIELEKKELKDQVITNIKKLILPAFEKLKKENLSSQAAIYLSIIERNLNDISSSLAKKVTDVQVKLSPREVEICNLIRNGLQNKEIAEILQISVLTIERHRFNIRKKLGIIHNKTNLQTYLQKY